MELNWIRTAIAKIFSMTNKKDKENKKIIEALEDSFGKLEGRELLIAMDAMERKKKYILFELKLEMKEILKQDCKVDKLLDLINLIQKL